MLYSVEKNIGYSPLTMYWLPLALVRCGPATCRFGMCRFIHGGIMESLRLSHCYWALELHDSNAQREVYRRTISHFWWNNRCCFDYRHYRGNLFLIHSFDVKATWSIVETERQRTNPHLGNDGFFMIIGRSICKDCSKLSSCVEDSMPWNQSPLLLNKVQRWDLRVLFTYGKLFACFFWIEPISADQ